MTRSLLDQSLPPALSREGRVSLIGVREVTDAPHLALLREIRDGQQAVLDELRALPSRIAAALDSQRRPLSDADLESLCILLPETSVAIGDLAFGCTPLVKQSEIDPDLRHAIERALGPLSLGTARRMGKLLRRAQGQTIGDLRVERAGDGRAGAVWRIVRVSAPIKPESNPQTRKRA